MKSSITKTSKKLS